METIKTSIIDKSHHSFRPFILQLHPSGLLSLFWRQWMLAVSEHLQKSGILTKNTFKSCSFWHRPSPIQTLKASYLSPLCRHKREDQKSGSAAIYHGSITHAKLNFDTNQENQTYIPYPIIPVLPTLKQDRCSQPQSPPCSKLLRINFKRHLPSLLETQMWKADKPADCTYIYRGRNSSEPIFSRGVTMSSMSIYSCEQK